MNLIIILKDHLDNYDLIKYRMNEDILCKDIFLDNCESTREITLYPLYIDSYVVHDVQVCGDIVSSENVNDCESFSPLYSHHLTINYFFLIRYQYQSIFFL